MDFIGEGACFILRVVFVEDVFVLISDFFIIKGIVNRFKKLINIIRKIWWIESNKCLIVKLKMNFENEVFKIFLYVVVYFNLVIVNDNLVIFNIIL